MPDAALEPRGLPSPEACRRFFRERGDVSLGLVPQLLLDEPAADTWAYFWYAGRLADDEIEAGRASAESFVQRLAGPDLDRPGDAAVVAFLDRLPPTTDRGTVLAELRSGLEALGRERAWQAPPRMTEYAEVLRAKSGVPLRILNRLLLPAEPEETISRFSLALAFSIQLGDDLRDHKRDAERGLHTITRDEIDAAHRDGLDPSDFVQGPLVRWREAAAQWLAIHALERADRFLQAEARGRARLETLLWLRAIELGQLRNPQRPLEWPAPLGSLLVGGPPTLARMAAARRVLYNEPSLLGNPKRWEPANRRTELDRLQRTFPTDLYRDLLRLAE